MSKRVYPSGSLKRKLKKQYEDKIKMLSQIINFLNTVTPKNLINKSVQPSSVKATDIISTF